MSERRPILFSAPMVRALLDGSKTQTRRLMVGRGAHKGSRFADVGRWCRIEADHTWIGWTGDVAERPQTEADAFTQRAYKGGGIRCPLGVVGDRLWVKEGIARFYDEGEPSVEYTATPSVLHSDAEWVWKSAKLPGMFMPRGLSRITLEITDVRVQRLQDISDDDAKAEGIAALTKDGKLYKYGIADRDRWPGNDDDGWHWKEWEPSPVQAYRKLWDSLNAKRASWASNPWVWALTFRRAALPPLTEGQNDG